MQDIKDIPVMENIKDIENYINNIPRFTKKHSIEDTRKFMEALKIDTSKMKIIHVAGTNGKGTVCAVLSSVLDHCKKKVGLFVSPHLIKINERIKINGKDVSDEEFIKAYKEVIKVTNELKECGNPTFFEFVFLMAMWIFTKNKVEYLVLETGMGGRLDATNAVKNKYLTVITPIGLDHMEYLGNTIYEIAGEKAGIIRNGVKNIFWDDEEDSADVILDKCDKIGSEAVSVNDKDYKIIKKSMAGVDFSMCNGYYKNWTFRTSFTAKYQIDDTVLALKTIENIEDIRSLESEIKAGIESVSWPGRMQMILPGVILDGAHNGQGIDAITREFEQMQCDGRKMLLFSVVKDKDYDYMVKRLSMVNPDKVYITRLDSSRGLDTDKIYNDFKKYQCKSQIEVIPDVSCALEKALKDKKEEDVLFCTGSLYLVGEVKKLIECKSIENK